MDIVLAIVEQVRDGSTVRVRLLMPEGDHQFVNISLAGVRCPRFASKQGESSEEFAEEVRYKLLICSAMVLNMCSYERPNSSRSQGYSNVLSGSNSFPYLHRLPRHSKTRKMDLHLLPRVYLSAMVRQNISIIIVSMYSPSTFLTLSIFSSAPCWKRR